jgi:hypothetical protein
MVYFSTTVHEENAMGDLTFPRALHEMAVGIFLEEKGSVEQFVNGGAI